MPYINIMSRPPSSSPPPPLSLSDYLAQTQPGSNSIDGYDGPTTGLTTSPEVSGAGDAREPMRAPGQEKTQAEPSPQEPQEQQVVSPNDSQDSRPTEWLATRSQLIPGRKQGGRVEWIRGWSEEVSVHSAEAYCACSEVMESIRARKGKRSGLAGGMRAMFQKSSPANQQTPVNPQPDICPNCSRPPSPPLNTTADVSYEKPWSRHGRRLGKMVTGLLTRISSRQNRCAHTPESEVRKLALPNDCQPKWAVEAQKRLWQRRPGQPVPQRHSMDILRQNSHARIVTPSSGSVFDGLSDSPGVRGGAAIAKTMSRLQRASALLQRTTRPPE
ncbi:hypothetical protein VTK56DRAFT_1545 [Thermocarpiscus australiensis]